MTSSYLMHKTGKRGHNPSLTFMLHFKKWKGPGCKKQEWDLHYSANQLFHVT